MPPWSLTQQYHKHRGVSMFFKHKKSPRNIFKTLNLYTKNFLYINFESRWVKIMKKKKAVTKFWLFGVNDITAPRCHFAHVNISAKSKLYAKRIMKKWGNKSYDIVPLKILPVSFLQQSSNKVLIAYIFVQRYKYAWKDT